VPEILEETTVEIDRVDLCARSPIVRPVSKKGRIVEPARTPGIHLSGVLRYIAIEGGLFKNIETDINEERLPLRMALGLAWEEFVVSLYVDIAWQPGERLVDGISMTCDGLSQSNDEPLLSEFKLTWKKVCTAEELVREQWYWMQQGKGYCWGYEARLVQWHVCFVNGNYKNSGPIYKRYLIAFTAADVESTRRMVLSNADRAKNKGYAE
jgi:hypothetical protein